MKGSLISLVGGASTALAAVRGFNYAAQEATQENFEASFKLAGSLSGLDNFNGARLYTMIQEGTTNEPIHAIPAAIDTKSTLLLGLWTSVPQSAFDNEITALKNAIQQYGDDLKNMVTGISVGSEDLYRISVTGLANDPTAAGQTPDHPRSHQGTALDGTPIGHVDTWNAFVNSSNDKVIAACDFLGLDEYPYFQTTDPNSIDNAANLFFEAYDKVKAVAQGAELWVTEAGWPVSGKQSGAAITGVDNAQTFWQEVACELIKRNINFWWYMLQDKASPDFSVASASGQPLYNLACNASSGYHPTTNNSSSSSTAPSSSKATASMTTISGTIVTTIPTETGEAGSPGAANAGAGSQTTGGSGATGSSSSASASGSSFAGAAGKSQASFIGLVLAAAAAVFAL
ncbi:putative glucan endo-1,3-beta-glucosidase eglC [Cyphellophora attinorum]|uniref:Probable glucan endo-1,3-beta-glucosidase eglC n=1 Tax=Cyphellophora attinorum TaxID=1664694 RepID=A0A0N1HDV8_9EURO|nr:putative glucan endo-1,3-beta-glucosidase eglC [Phialophora attinorum]KPI42966.1 putative glucan endo-1,3-beta-glucosidase eglC [Phialophora attinorum]